MKRVLFTAFMLVLAIFVHAQIVLPPTPPVIDKMYEITVDDAVEAIRQRYPENADIDFYYTDRSDIHYVNGTIYNSAPIEVLVDEEPEKGWEHNCTFYTIQRYYQVAGHAHFLSIQHLTLPPANRNYLLYESGDRFYLEDNYSQKNFTNDHASRTYAIIINGGSSNVTNNIVYWNDCSLIYQVMKDSYHVPATNIYSFISDGSATGHDQNLMDGTGFASSSVCLDGINVTPNLYSATASNISNIITSLSNTITANDQLFVFVTGPGRNGSLDLWGGDSLTCGAFGELLNAIHCKQISVLLGQSCGASFLESLQGDNRLVMAGYGVDECATFAIPASFTEFLFYWTYYCNNWSDDDDANDDGFLSFYEAYHCAKNDMNSFSGFVAPGDPYTTLAAFNHISGEDPSQPFGVDLYIRDNEGDTGEEPNQSCTEWWNSPDIYVRTDGNGFICQEDQDIDKKNVYVYVRVTNRGSEDYMGVGQYLHVYFGEGVRSMTPRHLYGISNPHARYTASMARLYVEDIIDTIRANESAIIEMGFTIPNNIWRNYLKTGNASYTIVAKISDSETDEYNPEDYDDQDIFNPLASRKIAMKSYERKEIETNASFKPVEMIYTGSTPSVQSYFELKTDSSSASLLEFADISLSLDDSLYTSWVANGQKVAFAEETGAYSRKIRFLSNYGKVKDVTLTRYQTYDIGASCKIVHPEMMEEGRDYTFHVIQKDKETGLTIGGFTYVIHKSATSILASLAPLNTSSVLIESVHSLGASAVNVQLSEAAENGMEITVRDAYQLSTSSSCLVQEGAKEVNTDLPSGNQTSYVVTLSKNGQPVDSKVYIKQK